MDLALTEEQLSVRESFAELFQAESPPVRVRAAEVAGFDERLWAGRHLASIPFAEAAVAARLLARLGAKELLESALSGRPIVTLATGAGPLEQQLLSAGAVADGTAATRGLPGCGPPSRGRGDGHRRCAAAGVEGLLGARVAGGRGRRRP
jgi:hypothetical protein